MTIQTINLGAPVTGEGGDTYRDAHTKINANFSDVSTSLSLKANTVDVDSKNALQDAAIASANNLAAAAIPNTEKGAVNGVATLDASGKVTPTQLPDATSTSSASGSFYNTTTTAAPNTTIAADGSLSRSTMVFGTASTKNVGTAVGQIPLSEQSFKATFSHMDGLYSEGYSADNVQNGELVLIQDILIPELRALAPSEDYFLVEQRMLYNGHQQALQTATGYATGCKFHRVRGYNGTFQTGWLPASTNPATYATTTASGANVAVDSTGKLMRSTSSERYKDILAPLVLDDVKYANAIQLAPIVYRSTADADNPLHHFYSFSAEALGAFDPAFTLWRYTEQVTDADGNTTEQPLVEKQAEGLNINAILAMSHAIAIKQDGLIKSLTDRIATLEAKGA